MTNCSLKMGSWMVTKGNAPASSKCAAGWSGPGFPFAIAIVEPDELIAVDSVERQDDHDDEIRNQQRNVKGVPAIDVVEGAVAVVGF